MQEIDKLGGEQFQFATGTFMATRLVYRDNFPCSISKSPELKKLLREKGVIGSLHFYIFA